MLSSLQHHLRPSRGRWEVMKFFLAVGLPRFHSCTCVSANVTVVFSPSHQPSYLCCGACLSWHLQNWPLWAHPPAAKLHKAECTSLHAVPGCEGRSKPARNGSGTVSRRAVRPSASCCGSEMSERGGLVSVLLHQLGFNEPPRGSQVPTGQWPILKSSSDLGVRSRWLGGFFFFFFFCWSVLLKHHYCISLCKPYGWAVAPTPSLHFQGVSGALSLFLGWLMRSQVFPTVADAATCTERWGERALHIISTHSSFYCELWRQWSIIKIIFSLPALVSICPTKHSFMEEELLPVKEWSAWHAAAISTLLQGV